MIACIISAESATLPGSIIFKYVVKTKCHYESPNGGSHHYSGQQKLVLRHYIGMLFKPCKKSEGCCNLRRVVAESSSSFGKKLCTCLLGTFYRPSVWHDSIKLWVIIHATYLFKYAFNRNLKGATSRPAHVQDFCLLCWFSQLSAILDLVKQADFWQQTSVYNTFTGQFLLVYLSIFFVKFYCGYRRETMIFRPLPDRRPPWEDIFQAPKNDLK